MDGAEGGSVPARLRCGKRWLLPPESSESLSAFILSIVSNMTDANSRHFRTPYGVASIYRAWEQVRKATLERP